MEFAIDNSDFSQLDDGDIVNALLVISPTYGFLMAAHLRNLPKTANYAAAVQMISSTASATSAYNYVTTKHKRAKSMMSPEVVTHAFASGGEVRPIENFQVPFRMNVDIDMDTVFQKVIAAEDHVVAASALGATVNGNVKMPGKGLAIVLDKEVACVPLVYGDPVFDTVGYSFLKDHSLDPVLIKSKEIITAHVLVDVVKLSKGKFVPKLPTAKLNLFDQDDVDMFTRTTLDVVQLFQKSVVKYGSQRGRVLMRTFLQVMRDSRQMAGYEAFLDRIVAWSKKERAIRCPSKLGDYTISDLAYARTLLDATRGIRGGDDGDSTSLGLSAYLDFNTDRSIVKYMARATDISLIISQMDVDHITLVGKHSPAYLEALLMINTKIKVIGVSNPQLPGWTMKGIQWSHDSYSVKLTTERVGLVINVDKLSLDLEKCETYQSDCVQLIDCPIDYTSNRYMPSCLVHNLTGWLLPRKMSKTLIKTNLLRVTCIMNIVRTYPSLFPGQRCVDALRKIKYRVIDASLYRRIAKTARADGFQTLLSSKGPDGDYSLLDFIGDDEAKALVNNLVTRKAAPLRGDAEVEILVGPFEVQAQVEELPAVEEYV